MLKRKKKEDSITSGKKLVETGKNRLENGAKLWRKWQIVGNEKG